MFSTFPGLSPPAASSTITPTSDSVSRQGQMSPGKQVCVLVTHSCPTLCNPMDYSPPGSSVHGILQTRILEWVATPFSWGSSRPGDLPHPGTNLRLLHCRQILYSLSHQRSLPGGQKSPPVGNSLFWGKVSQAHFLSKFSMIVSPLDQKQIIRTAYDHWATGQGSLPVFAHLTFQWGRHN